MDCIDNHLWLVVVTILSLMTHSFGATLEGISTSTAMKLVLLRNYQQRVARHGVRADETHRKQFMDTWESVLDNHDTAVKILNRIEKDWMYTLHLTRRNQNVITDLILSLNSKILAVHQVAIYLISLWYYTRVPTGTKLEDCRNVVAHLFIFSYQGTNELLRGFKEVFNDFLSEEELTTIETFEEGMETSQIIRIVRDMFIHKNNQLVRPNEIQIQEIEIDIQHRIFTHERLTVHQEIRHQEKLLLKFILGALKDSVRDEGVLGPIWHLNRMKLFWHDVEDINKYLTKQTSNSSLEVEHTMVDVIRAGLIKRSEVNHVSRRNIAEKFEGMIPDNFQIFISNNKITNNANLDD